MNVDFAVYIITDIDLIILINNVILEFYLNPYFMVVDLL